MTAVEEARSGCDHGCVLVAGNLVRLPDSDRWNVEVRLTCQGCGEPFRFRGLPVGLNLDGAAVSVDGLEARLAVHPAGEEPLPLGDHPAGFAFRPIELEERP